MYMSSEVGVTDCKSSDVIQKVEIHRPHLVTDLSEHNHLSDVLVNVGHSACIYLLKNSADCYCLGQICIFSSCIKTYFHFISSPLKLPEQKIISKMIFSKSFRILF